MQCKCGGATSDHKVIKDKAVVGSYAQCVACGRIHWLQKPATT